MERWRVHSPRPRSATSRGDPSSDPPTSVAYWRRRLGRKVSLRLNLHDDPAHPFSEAIGMVSAVEGDDESARVSVVNRRGETSSFAVVDVVAAKDL